MRLCLVCRCRDLSSSSSPVDVDILALGVLSAGELRLDPEGVRAEVVTLCLQEVGGQVLRTVTVVEAEGGAKGRSGDTPESSLGHNALRC
jgi:hypothetical protein